MHPLSYPVNSYPVRKCGHFSTTLSSRLHMTYSALFQTSVILANSSNRRHFIAGGLSHRLNKCWFLCRISAAIQTARCLHLLYGCHVPTRPQRGGDAARCSCTDQNCGCTALPLAFAGAHRRVCISHVGEQLSPPIPAVCPICGTRQST